MPLYLCSLTIENNVNLFLHDHHFQLQRQNLVNSIKLIEEDINNESNSDFVNILLFGTSKYEKHINSKMLNFSIAFIP